MLRAEKFGGMARKLRLQYPGAIYHVMNRGDRREDIFLDDEDRQRFLDTLGETCQKAERFIEQMLMQSHWSEKNLTERRKCDPAKVWMAGRLRAGTTTSWKWIAEILRMGNGRSVANAVRSAGE